MEEIIDTPIEKEMQSSYIDYAMSVIVGRALPDARDGLKPAQRRILYAMYKLNNLHNQPTKKSARVVGETMGKYHPHGDMAIYDTLVRMAQPFTMNHTLVEGQGNMGSIDGDPPAASRYTEVRLTKYSEELLDGIEKEAVQMLPNFDNTENEPKVLPAKIPNLLVNGSSGIAVGVATNILPHNLREVCNAILAYLDNMAISVEDLAKNIKGPDFPTGGIVYYDSKLRDSYLKGRGRAIIRGKAEIENSKDKQSIIIKEIPYNVNKAQLAEDIAQLARDKVLQGIADVRDESSKEGIRLVVELKKDANGDALLNALYKHTQLQVSTPVMNIAVMDNSLLTLNIKQFIKVFVDHRFDVITNISRYDLSIAKDRQHIIQGLITAVNNIDDVIALLRKSADIKEARQALINTYALSEKQANAILDMKLSRLTALEISSLIAEEKAVEAKIEELNSILSDKQKVYDIIREETKEISDKYARDRYTTIEEGELEEIIDEDLIENSDATVILTRDGYIKRMPSEVFKEQGKGGKGVKAMELKEGDMIMQIIPCKLKDTLLMLTNQGRAHQIKAYAIPAGDRYSQGKAAVNILSLREGEKIAKIINMSEAKDSFIVFLTEKGLVKKTAASKFENVRSTGIIAIKLESGDGIADACISNGKQLFISTKEGKAIRFNESDIRPSGRGARGVRGIRKAHAANILAIEGNELIATITEKGFGKLTEASKYRLQHRGGSGVLNLKVKEKTGQVIKSLVAKPNDSILLVSSTGLSIKFPAMEIRKTGRAASGVRIMK
ncbi:MAG: DNA gyrase subunit A, partial [Candidatus Micrarchaeaceae archaeon]